MTRLFVALALFAVGCSGKVTTADVDAYPPADTSASADTAVDTAKPDAPHGTPELCAKCVDTQCKATWDACLADKTCTDRLDCLAACTTSACQSACVAAHPSAHADAMQACFTGPCKDACTATSSS